MSIDVHTDKRCDSATCCWGVGAFLSISAGIGAAASAVLAGAMPFELERLLSEKDTISKVSAICCKNISIPTTYPPEPLSEPCLEAFGKLWGRSDLATIQDFFQASPLWVECEKVLPEMLQGADKSILFNIGVAKTAVKVCAACLGIGALFIGGSYALHSYLKRCDYTPIKSSKSDVPLTQMA